MEQLEVHIRYEPDGELVRILRAMCCGQESIIALTIHAKPRAVFAMGYTWVHVKDGVVHEMDAVLGSVGATRCRREVWVDYPFSFPPMRLDATHHTITCCECIGSTPLTLADLK